jgi:lactoylglutathione lyase
VIIHLPLHDFAVANVEYSPDSSKSVSHGKHMSDREGVLELSYNYGVEKTHKENEDPKGFGHICVSVDNIQAACKRLSDAGCKFQKTLQYGCAFVLDPDEYWVKLIAQNPVHETENVTTTDVQSYNMNHTMLRIKDKDVSLKLYEDVFGMMLKHTFRNPEAGFDSYFLGYALPGGSDNIDRPNPEAKNEGLLELIWNYGTEKKDGMVYHNGNTEAEGFGHICISVDDIEAACERFDKKRVSWQKRLMDGPFRVAFIIDPDGYVSASILFIAGRRIIKVPPNQVVMTDLESKIHYPSSYIIGYANDGYIVYRNNSK